MTCQTDLVPRRQSTVTPWYGLGIRAWQRSGHGMAGSTMPTRHMPVLRAMNHHKCVCSHMFSAQLCSVADSISSCCKTAHLPVWQFYPPFKGVKLPRWDRTAQVETQSRIHRQSASRL
jgi:hypothetical protein